MSDLKESEYYERGMVKVATPKCADVCLNREHEHYVSSTNLPAVYLPHSCDEWIIGGRKEVEAMIADLQNALAALP